MKKFLNEVLRKIHEEEEIRISILLYEALLVIIMLILISDRLLFPERMQIIDIIILLGMTITVNLFIFYILILENKGKKIVYDILLPTIPINIVLIIVKLEFYIFLL